MAELLIIARGLYGVVFNKCSGELLMGLGSWRVGKIMFELSLSDDSSLNCWERMSQRKPANTRIA